MARIRSHVLHRELQLDEWPEVLLDLDPPLTSFFIRGELPRTRFVAIVGTRRADPPALRFASRLAGALAAHGITVVSGGASGIDTAAHSGALNVGGRTVAVLAGGVVRAYPAQNAPLFARIIESGAVVSEHLDVPDHKGRFLARNRIIAALSECTVVVQAPFRSGALSTAKAARALGRPVFAVPASPWDERGAGCSRLIASGAHALVDIGHFMNGLGCSRVPSADASSKATSALERLGSEAALVFAALSRVPRHPDAVAAEIGLSPSSVHVAVFELTIAGLAEERAGGCVARIETESASPFA